MSKEINVENLDVSPACTKPTVVGSTVISSAGHLFDNIDCFDFLRKLQNDSCDLIIIDPPYNTTNADFEVKIDLEKLFSELNRVAKNDAAIICFASLPFTFDVISANRKYLKYSMVWNKRFGANFFQANIMPMKVHEDIIVFCKGKTKFNPQKVKRKTPLKIDFRPAKNKDYVTVYGHSNEKVKEINKDYGYFEFSNPTTILDFERKKDGKNISPTQKPIDLIRYLIKSYSDPGDTVLDCFAGSCTTGIAAHIEGRFFLGCEFHDRYYKKAKKRFENIICAPRIKGW